MKSFDPSRSLRGILLLSLLTVSACGEPFPQGGQVAPKAKTSVPVSQAEAMVASLYKEVVARHPGADMGDPKVFGPYFSKGLLHRYQDYTACYDDWERRNPGTTDKPPFGLLNMNLYWGASEGMLDVYFDGSGLWNPQTFQIEKTETGKDGVSRVYVKLTYVKPGYNLYAYVDPRLKTIWRIAVAVVRENGRSVVDDLIYLDEYKDRLSEILGSECKGPRWKGWYGQASINDR